MVRSGVDPFAPWLQEQLGIQLTGRSAVGGGCIHQAWCLETKGEGRLFAKTNRANNLPLLEAEADGLVALAKVAPPGLHIPSPLALGLAGEQAVLVLPWLELTHGHGQARGWAECGANLARLHRNSRSAGHPEERPVERFGWKQDNFIGASPQINAWQGSWREFFVECRLRPQLQAQARKGCLLANTNVLLERLLDSLGAHQPPPCLVHGDLWSGNAALLAGGGAGLFDPAVYYGDRETDLAMARLFGGFPEAFFDAYNEEWALDPGWERRINLYNLYHLLNHANLFGGSYIKQAQSALEAELGWGDELMEEMKPPKSTSKSNHSV